MKTERRPASLEAELAGIAPNGNGTGHRNGWMEGEPAGNGVNGEEEEAGYRAAEWTYDSATYYATSEPVPLENEPGESALRSLPEQGASRGWGVKDSGSSIAPRPNVKMFGRRPSGEPRDTEGKILAVSAQLQQLLERRREETEADLSPSRVYQNHGKRSGFKPVGSPVSNGARLPLAPPISLPIRPHQMPSTGRFFGRLFNFKYDGAPVDLVAPILGVLVVLGLLGGAYLWGRANAMVQLASAAHAKPTAPIAPPIPPAAWTDAQITELDGALVADRAGDLKGALKIASELNHKSKGLLGLGSYISGLEVRLNDPEAESTVIGSVDLNNVPGQEGEAFVASRARDFAKATDWLGRAAGNNPFNAQAFYLLGGALRRRGNTIEAATRFEEALERIPAEPEFTEQRERVGFLERLAQTESGHKADVIPDLEAQQKAGAMNGYWCLTAAAIAVQDGEWTQAANWLTRARAVLDANRFENSIDDYFFRGAADHPEIAPFFNSLTASQARRAASRTAFFVDP